MTTGLPFDDFRALLRRIPPAGAAPADMVGAVTGGLGRLNEIVGWLAGVTGKARPAVARPLIALFAGAHAFDERIEAASPAAVAASFIERSGKGEAAINRLCAANDLGLKVFDLALDLPIADITTAPALDEKACAATMAFGMEAMAGGADMICLGGCGPASAVSAAALACAVFGGKADKWLGESATPAQAEAARAAVLLHRAALADPLEALRRLGGREHAALAGAILAARIERIPVILDGLAALAAAAILWKADKSALDHCLLTAAKAGSPQEKLGRALGLRPLFDLDVEDGEGISAALAASLVKNAVTARR